MNFFFLLLLLFFASKSYKGKDGYQKSQSPERLPQVVLAKRLENRGTPMEAGKQGHIVTHVVMINTNDDR